MSKTPRTNIDFSNHSCQDPYDYSPEITVAAIKGRMSNLKGMAAKTTHIGYYYQRCINHSDNYYDYISVARDIPPFMNSEDIIVGKLLNNALMAVFDAFEEMCNKMKNSESYI